MPDSTISLSFRYSESDYGRALRAHYASRLRLWLDVCVIIAAGIAAVLSWPSPELHWLSVTMLSVSGAFALILLAAFIVIPPLVFRSEPKFRDEYILTFSHEGIHFNTAHVNSDLQWSLYSRALVDAHSYLLYYGRRSFTIIPRRVFQSIGQQKAFEQLLADHVPKIIRRK